MAWLVVFLLIASFSLAEECAFLFYGENCPGCDDADAYIQNIEQNKPEFTVQRYEVYYNKEHADLAKQYFAAYNIPEESQGLPVLFLPKAYFIGSDPIKTLSSQYLAENAIDDCPSLNPGEVVGVVGKNSPLDVLKTLSFVTITGGALKDAFHLGMLGLVLLFVMLLAGVKNSIQSFQLGIKFIIAVYAVYFLFALGLLTWFASSPLKVFFYRGIGLFAVIYGLMIIKQFWSNTKKENALQVFAENIGRYLRTPIGIVAVGLAASICSFAGISPTFLSLRFAFAGASGWMALPIVLYYLLLMILPLGAILAIWITLQQKYHLQAEKEGRTADVWRKHHHKVMRTIVGIICVVLGLAVLFL